MRWLKLILTTLSTLLLLILLNTKVGLVPPLGKFLDPFHGFWQNAETGTNLEERVLRFNGLKAPVTILFDDRRVPHIFAENDQDLYFAQGYITAKDRLWQMEFQTHAAAGRLSEIVGEQALEYDRFRRRIGMVYGAKNAVKEMEAVPEVRELGLAYTHGINAYIKNLDKKDYPTEYKILDYAPEPWTPLKSALLLKYMAWMLTGRSSDLQMSHTLAKFGEEVVKDLFPHYPKNMDPVIPEGTLWNFPPIKIIKPQAMFIPNLGSDFPAYQPDLFNGSNNWVVSGSKTASGYPILANDPHLGLNLPSIWYEIQLVSPTVNVYGVSLPGSPNVIVGFNKNIAWGVTNAEADVMDWYEIKFKDGLLNEYWYDNAWRTTHQVIEEIKLRGGKTIQDTITYTHHGPIVTKSKEKPFSRQVPPLHALRWLAHEPSNEALAFYKLNRASNYNDYVEALSHYVCPAQNFVFADVQGDIAIWHNGKFPAKWEGQGKYIGDGSDPLYDWQGWIPHEQNPHIKNPKRGFVGSANQNPTDSNYPYYLNWYFAPYFRGHRINQLLAKMENITPDDFRKMQLDTKNLHAESVLPTLLDMIDERALNLEESEMFRVLSSWDFLSDAQKLAPTIFDQWWRKLYRAIWNDEFGGADTFLRYPSKERTIQMIVEEPQAKWFDNVHTGLVETLAQLVNSTFTETHEYLVKTLGPMNDTWQWGKYKGTVILHLAQMPGFGRLDLFVDGDLGIINATGRRHGPSWRMVVALGPEVKAWGIYPGGQSGNPGSPHYDDFIDDWIKGELAELLFLKSKEEKSERIVSRLIMEGERP